MMFVKPNTTSIKITDVMTMLRSINPLAIFFKITDDIMKGAFLFTGFCIGYVRFGNIKNGGLCFFSVMFI